VKGEKEGKGKKEGKGEREKEWKVKGKRRKMESRIERKKREREW